MHGLEVSFGNVLVAGAALLGDFFDEAVFLNFGDFVGRVTVGAGGKFFFFLAVGRKVYALDEVFENSTMAGRACRGNIFGIDR